MQAGYLFVHDNRVCAFVGGLSQDKAAVEAKKLMEAAYRACGESREVNVDDFDCVPVVEHEGHVSIAWDSHANRPVKA